MTDAGNGAPNADQPMDFTTAEFADQATGDITCELCKQPITDYYYQVAGRTACKRCQPQVAAHLAKSPRFWRAAGFGVLAAAAGSALWYAVATITGYELGLIAIVVGLMVGGAVKVGSGRVGGLSVQLLAVVLTYTAIVSSYAPAMIKEFKRLGEASETSDAKIAVGRADSQVVYASTGALPDGAVEAGAFVRALGAALTAWSADSADDPARERALDTAFAALEALLAVNASPRFTFGDSGVAFAGAPLEEAAAWEWSGPLAKAGYASLTFQPGVSRLEFLRLLDNVGNRLPSEGGSASGPVQVALALAVLVAFLYLSPILAGVSNLIGILIIGFALWEAWKINRRPEIEISGPFRVGGAGASTP